MTILLTRPYEQSLAMNNLLARKGISSFVEPMLEISPYNFNQSIFDSSKALIITSLNASHCVAKQENIDKNNPIFSIGSATSAPLKQAGFKKIHEADGNAKSLLKLIKNEYTPSSGLITYLSGQNITQDLARDLCLLDYNSERVVVYKATLKNQLSHDLIKRIRRKEIKAVIFMSCRTATNFIRLCLEAELSYSLKHINAIVISQNVAESLKKTTWKNIIIAEHPSQECIISKIIINQSTPIN